MKLLGIAMDDLNFQNKIMGVCRGKSRTTTSQEQQLMQQENFLIKKQVLVKCFGHGIIMQDKIRNVTIPCIMPACIWNHINIQWRVVKTLLWQDHDDRGPRRWKQNTKKSYRALLAWGEIWHYLRGLMFQKRPNLTFTKLKPKSSSCHAGHWSLLLSLVNYVYYACKPGLRR